MEEAKKRQTIAKGQFTRAEGLLKRVLDAESDESLLWTVEKRYAELKTRWNNVQEVHDEYVTFLADQNLIDTEEAWISELAERFDEIEVDTGKYIQSKQTPHKTEGELVQLITQQLSQHLSVQAAAPHALSQQAAEALPAQRIMRIEPIKFQSFSGEIRRYPEFKAEFLAHIKPLCAPNQELTVLKSYLVDHH